MTLPAVGSASYPSVSDSRDAMLRLIKSAFTRRGIAVNVLPGGEHYIRCDAIASRLAIAYQNNKLALAEQSPLTATADNLTDISAIYGVTRRAAAGAAGLVDVTCTGTVTIPAAFSCTAPNGLKYETDAAYTVTTSASIGVVGTSTGTASNQSADTVLTWDSAAIGNLSNQATVGDDGLVGGAEADTDSTLRQRLISRLSFPSVGGNWSAAKAYAEAASSSVQAAFVYSAVRGPASLDIALTLAGGDRTLAAETVTAVNAYVVGQMPGNMSISTQATVPQEVDVVVNASLPLPATAGGAGGGWLDASPWPTNAEAAPVKITVIGGLTLTVNSTATPTVGNHIAVWDNVNGEMVELTITTVGGVLGAWTIVCTEPITALAVGMFVSPGAVNMVDYGASLVSALALLGPGEKSSDLNIVPRALRKPAPDVSWPTDITSIQLASLTTAYPEILGLDYAFRYATGTAGTLSSPDVAATTADPPNILVPKHLAFRYS